MRVKISTTGKLTFGGRFDPLTGQIRVGDEQLIPRVSSATPAAFTPADLGAKLLLATEASDILGVDGAHVATMTDTSGNGYVIAEKAEAWGPTLKVVAGANVIRSSGSLGQLSAAMVPIPAEVVIFAVIKPAGLQGFPFGVTNVEPVTEFSSSTDTQAGYIADLTDPHFFGYRYKPSDFFLLTIRVQDGYQRVYENGIPRKGFTRTRSSSTGFYIGTNATTDGSYYGDTKCCYVTGALTDAELGKMHAYLTTLHSLPLGTQVGDKVRVLTLGDSLFADFGGGSTVAVRLQTLLGSDYIVENQSYGGRLLFDATPATPPIDILHCAPFEVTPGFGESAKNILVPYEYYNVRTETAADIYAAYAALCTAAQNAGWRVLSVNDFHSDSNIPGAVALVDAGASGFSDGHADINLQSLRDNVALTDGVHPDSAGKDIMAGVLSDAILAL